MPKYWTPLFGRTCDLVSSNVTVPSLRRTLPSSVQPTSLEIQLLLVKFTGCGQIGDLYSKQTHAGKLLSLPCRESRAMIRSTLLPQGSIKRISAGRAPSGPPTPAETCGFGPRFKDAGSLETASFKIINLKTVMMNSGLSIELRPVGAVSADDRTCFVAPALQKRQVEQRIDDHPRPAREDFAFLEAEMFLIKIAEHFRLLGNKRDMSEFSHASPSAIDKSLIRLERNPVNVRMGGYPTRSRAHPHRRIAART